MNWMVFTAGVVAVFVNIGHLTMGSKLFLTPMLAADFDVPAKKIMHSVFHYVSVFLILSAVVLILSGLGVNPGGDVKLLIWFISANYAAFAIIQIIIAMTSGIPRVMTKMFQWIFFMIIALFSFLGTCAL